MISSRNSQIGQLTNWLSRNNYKSLGRGMPFLTIESCLIKLCFNKARELFAHVGFVTVSKINANWLWLLQRLTRFQ
jgi:hypothetical protein